MIVSKWMIVAVGVFAACAVAQVPTTTAPTELGALNPSWLEAMQGNIDQQIEMLSTAYGLDEPTVRLLREELNRRLLEQVPMEQQYQKDKVAWAKQTRQSKGGLRGVSPEARRAFMAGLKQRLETFPLNENRVAEWLESQLPPDRVGAGRERLQELKHRRDAHRAAYESDTSRRAGGRTASFEEKKTELAPVSLRDRPLPNGPRGKAIATSQPDAEPGQVVRPNQGLTVEPQKPSPPPKIEGQGASSAQALASSLPIDEWDRHVVATAQKYGYTEDQITKARSILSELRQRAEQYRSSRAGEYARAQLLADPKDRAERMKQLDAGTEALFAELKVRLDSLLTPEQRQKAVVQPPRR